MYRSVTLYKEDFADCSTWLEVLSCLNIEFDDETREVEIYFNNVIVDMNLKQKEDHEV